MWTQQQLLEGKDEYLCQSWLAGTLALDATNSFQGSEGALQGVPLLQALVLSGRCTAVHTLITKGASPHVCHPLQQTILHCVA